MLIHLILVVTLRSVLFSCATNEETEAWGKKNLMDPSKSSVALLERT